MNILEELLVAKIDLHSLITDKQIKVTQELKAQASKLLNKSEMLIDRILSAKDIKPKTISSNIKLSKFDEYRDLLSEGIDIDQLTKKLEKLPYGSSKHGLTAILPQMINLAADMVPQNRSITLTGIDERPPSDREKFKFIQKLRVLDDPLIVFDLMEAGLLNQTEMDALKLFYPEMHTLFVRQMLDRLTELKKNPSMRQNQQISVFLEVPRLNPETMKRLQMQYEEEQPKEGPKGDALAQNLSETQKVEAR